MQAAPPTMAYGWEVPKAWAMALTAAIIWPGDGYSTIEVEAMLKGCENEAEIL